MYEWLHKPEIDMGTWFLTGFGVFGAITALILALIERKLLKISQNCQYSSHCRSNDPYPAPIMYEWLHNPEIDMGTWFLTGFGVFGGIITLILAEIEPKLLKISQIVNVRAIVTQMIPTPSPLCMIGYVILK